MKIIEVIPIAKAINTDTLTYFSSKDIAIGNIVDIPIRKKSICGVVISVQDVQDMKSEIKKADFSLKKIDKIKSKNRIPSDFIDMAREMANYYATNIGSILNILLPNYLIDNIGKLDLTHSEKKNDSEIVHVKIRKEKYAVQGDDEERYGAWKSLIRQEFARKKSIFFLTPTIEDANKAFELLEKGIEGYAFLLHGSLSEKKIIEVWNKIMSEKHPVVVIATGGFLSLPREDIETIVIEKENNKAYKIPRRPYLDIREIAERIAKRKNMKVFFSDILLSLETLYRESQGDILQSSPFKFRSLSTAIDSLVDMKKNKTGTNNFKILSDEVETLILKTKNDSEQMIILATRRGISPATVCGDCQNIVTCNNCSSPVVLHKGGNNDQSRNFFMCHRCGERRSTEEYCKVCGSWKLGVVGIGIDLVIQKIKDKFPDINIFQLDSDIVKTDKAAKAIVQKFKAKPGSILIGTEMILQYLHDKVENSAIISLDSLFALPDFRIQEKILYTMIRMRALSSRNFIVQTRKPDEKVFEFGLKGNMSDFYRDAIEERKRFNYPPFFTLIKLTIEGKKDDIVKEMDIAQNILDPYEVEIFPAFTHTVRGNLVLHGLIRVPYEKWPISDLVDKLRMISPTITIKVDPETLL